MQQKLNCIPHILTKFGLPWTCLSVHMLLLHSQWWTKAPTHHDWGTTTAVRTTTSFPSDGDGPHSEFRNQRDHTDSLWNAIFGKNSLWEAKSFLNSIVVSKNLKLGVILIVIRPMGASNFTNEGKCMVLIFWTHLQWTYDSISLDMKEKHMSTYHDD